MREIAELIALDAFADRVRVRELANARVAALDGNIEDMRQAREALAELASDYARKRGGPCPILTAFDR